MKSKGRIILTIPSIRIGVAIRITFIAIRRLLIINNSGAGKKDSILIVNLISWIIEFTFYHFLSIILFLQKKEHNINYVSFFEI